MMAKQDIENVAGIVMTMNKAIFKMTFQKIRPVRRNSGFSLFIQSQRHIVLKEFVATPISLVFFLLYLNSAVVLSYRKSRFEAIWATLFGD